MSARRAAVLALAIATPIVACGRTHGERASADPSAHVANAPSARASVAPSTSAPAPAPTLRKRTRTAKAGTHRGAHVDDISAYDTLRNPTDGKGHAIFANEHDECFYETSVYVPPGTFPPMGWRGRDRHPIDCPPSMDDPLWDECAPGELLEDRATGRCVCEAVESVMGPSTPRDAIACPPR